MSAPENKTPETTGISKAQELVYELLVKEVMKTEVIVVSPDSTMKELMAILRVNRISGTPVVKDGKLIGIISIEDLIKAFAQQRFNDLVSDHMTANVVTVRADDHAVQAVELFAQHGFGRLPVLDREGNLVGIITGSNITNGLLDTLNKQMQSEEVRRYRASHIFEDIVSDNTSLVLRYQIDARNFDKGGQASSTLKKTLQRLGVDPVLLRRINVSAYEAEMNLIIHTENGGEMRVEISPERIVLVTEDTGPGIEDVDQAFKPGYSTAADWVRELGFGAGMGLCNIKRYSDQVAMTSIPGRGSVLSAVFMIGSEKDKQE
jgi:CBS domain-containing protein/anti-sigma regulatory factor (Ser/Thr protein kinase)